MDENVAKIQQGMWFVVSDLEKACRDACAVNRPEGHTFGDRALIRWLGERMGEARKLYSDLTSL